METPPLEDRMLGRPPMNQEEFDRKYCSIEQNGTSLTRQVLKRLKKRYVDPLSTWRRLWMTFIGFVPIFDWLPRYSIKTNLLYDVVGGITVGLMNIPQGIAYSMLAGQDAVIGLYTSFFAPLVYMVFGTSRHCSIGTFAVVALMAGTAVERIANPPDLPVNSTAEYTPIQVAVTLTCVVGIFEILIAAVGFSFVTTYFSDELVGGFTTGASLYVFTTQLKDILGITLSKKREGMGQIFYTIYDLACSYKTVNWVTTGLSAAVLFVLIIGRYIINPFFQKKTGSPVAIPFDLVVVIFGALASSLLNLNVKQHVATVGKIPTGLPEPVLPCPSLFMTLIPDAISIAIVVVAIHISLAKMFGKKYNYPVDTTQEFYALGLTSLISSFFPVFPNSCSLSRTVVNANSGTKTQLFSVFSAILILLTLQFIGKWLAPLPMAVLAAIIIVALFGMFEKLATLPKLWKLSKVDFSIWMVAFLATIATTVTIGLGISIVFALFTTVARAQWGKWRVLVNISGTSDYRDVQRYKDVFFFDGICIFRFDSPLMFSNVDRFRKALVRVASDERYSMKMSLGDKEDLIKEVGESMRCIIIDCSPFVFIDLMGANTLKEVYSEMKERGIQIAFAAARGSLRDLFNKCDPAKLVPRSAFFPTIHDAICLAKTLNDTSSLKSSSSFTPTIHSKISDSLDSIA